MRSWGSPNSRARGRSRSRNASVRSAPSARTVAAGARTRSCGRGGRRTPAGRSLSRSSSPISRRGPRLKAPRLRPGSSVITPRMVNVCVPMRIGSPTRRASCARNSGRTSAAIAQQVVAVGALAQTEGPIERKRGLHRAQLHHLRDDPGRIGRPHHRGNLHGLGDVRDTALPLLCRQRVAHTIAEGRVARDQNVGRDERPRLARQRGAYALDHRPQRDDRPDADGDAERRRRRAASTRPGSRAAPSGPRSLTGRPPRRRAIRRPSRSTRRRSASAASWGSCVTSTSVVPRVARTPSSRSRMKRPVCESAIRN